MGLVFPPLCGSKDQTEVIRLGVKHHYSQGNLTSPVMFYFMSAYRTLSLSKPELRVPFPIPMFLQNSKLVLPAVNFSSSQEKPCS